jgi:hypothetical protein
LSACSSDSTSWCSMMPAKSKRCPRWQRTEIK